MKILEQKIKELKMFLNEGANHKQHTVLQISVEHNSQELQDNPTLRPQPILRNEIIFQRQKLLKPIETKSEYRALLNEIINYRNSENKPFLNMSGYQDTDEELKGLVPYCGEGDKSCHINMWLTARQNRRRHLLDDDKMSKIVRVLDYSLKALDEKTGKYEGIVYRKGFFNPITDKQYYSSSTVPEGAILHSGDTLPSADNPYSIIKLKNGHNIYKFQEQTNSKTSNIFAAREREILIDRKSGFRLITPDKYSENDKKLKKLFMSNFITTNMNSAQTDELFKKYNELPYYIQIWEEI